MTLEHSLSSLALDEPRAIPTPSSPPPLHVVPEAPACPDALATLDDPTETAMFARLVERAVTALRPASVLDVGCGTGIPTLAALRAGAPHVTGIDIVERNVELARATLQSAPRRARVCLEHASWDDVIDGKVDGGGMELVVANPPYVPDGRGCAVNGGPRGTRLLHAIIEQAPRRTRGLALLFGSISDPLTVLEKLRDTGFEVLDVLAQSVPFGQYTSRPRTLETLRALRKAGHAWFCDVDSRTGHAPHAYLTLGAIARRRTGFRSSEPDAAGALARTLAAYQTRGPRALACAGFASILQR